MGTRNWFARRRIVLNSEQVEVKVASPPSFTRNGQQVAVIGDIPPSNSFIFEGVGVPLVGANITPILTPIVFAAPTIPPINDGISVILGQVQLTKKGLYWIKLRPEVSDECNLFCVMKLNGVNQDASLTHVPTLGGSIRYASFMSNLAIPSDSVNTLSFEISGETTPIAGNPLSYGGSSFLIIHHWNFN